eukprot:SAG11_NODE_26156_length_349_cov_0.620000_2_plen_65_part_01
MAIDTCIHHAGLDVSRHLMNGLLAPIRGSVGNAIEGKKTDDAGHAILFVSAMRASGVPARALVGH